MAEADSWPCYLDALRNWRIEGHRSEIAETSENRASDRAGEFPVMCATSAQRIPEHDTRMSAKVQALNRPRTSR